MAALSGQNIVCFAKDWGEDPTSNHHVMIELAKHNRVLWLNSIATRTPKLGSGRDLRKIKNKLASFAKGPVQVGESMWVYTPLVLPFPHLPAARVVNRAVLQATLFALRLQLKMDRFQLWTFLPNVADYVGSLGESLAVYYCVDEWSQFSYIDEARTVATERLLCERVDAIFAVNDALVERKRPFNPETHLATHGVDHALFAKALSPDTVVPADIAGLPRPILGFYGTLQDWVDQRLLCALADRHPEWTLALIGQKLTDCSELERRPNVHLLGRKPHGELPAYCKAFDVGLIPYVISERMKFVNPVKLREYLSAGLPVVSTAVPEVARYGRWCDVAESQDDFEAFVVRALASSSADRARERSDAMRSETWEHKIEAVGSHVARLQNARDARNGRAA